MASVNTNAAAITALRTLQQTNNSLDMTQNRISTGLKIGEAKDNAAYWAISTTLKSDNKSLSTVKDALNLGASTVDVAYQGLSKAKDVLDEIKAKLTAATQDGVNRDTIQQEIGELQKQLKSIASSSVFSGENWLSVNSGVSDYSSAKSIVASFARDASGAVSIGTIAVDTTDASLFDSNTTTNNRGVLDTANGLKTADGRTLSVGGTASALGNTAKGGLATAEGSATGTSATASYGVFDGTFIAMTAATDFAAAGDTLNFAFTVEGAARTVSISKADATLVNGASVVGEIQNLTELANIFNKKVTNQGVEAYVTAANTLGIRSISAGTATTVVATGVTVTAVTAGFTVADTGLAAAPTSGLQTDGVDAASARLVGGTTQTLTLDGDDQISFLVQTGSDSAKAIIIDKALIDSALGGTTGTITSTANWQTVVQAAMNKAGVKATVAVGALVTNRLEFTSTATGGSATLKISEVSAVAGAATISVADMDISSTGLTSKGAISKTQISAVLSAYISNVNSAITKVTEAAANLGSVASRIDMQRTFVNTLMDTIDKGVGNLIDADMSEESTKLQALQVKQQLGVQALSIANQSSQNILRLFQTS